MTPMMITIMISIFITTGIWTVTGAMSIQSIAVLLIISHKIFSLAIGFSMLYHEGLFLWSNTVLQTHQPTPEMPENNQKLVKNKCTNY